MAEKALDEDEVLEFPGRRLTRTRLRDLVARRYSTRVHMSLILACCGLTAMTSSWFLLHYAGVHWMLVRYPIALFMAYGTFLIGVWVWIRATGLASRLPPEEPVAASKAKKKGKGGLDIDLPGGGGSSGGGGSGIGGGWRGGGGGTFDGGGASASFAEGPTPTVAAQPPSGSSLGSKAAGSLFDGIDGDGIVLLILALVLVCVVFAASGYLVWCAPDVLTEAAFGAALTGTLVRPARSQGAGGWIAGVVRKTWWPFAIVLAAAMAFAGWSAAHYPKASTFREAIVMAIHSEH